MFEQRLTARLMDYWLRLKKDEVMPDYRWNNTAVIDDLWPQCFVVSILPHQGTFYKYEYVGPKVKEAFGRDPTGQTVDFKIKHFPNSVIAAKLPAVLEIETPQESEGQTPAPNGKILKYRAILLPFGNAKDGLTHVVVGLSYRFF